MKTIFLKIKSFWPLIAGLIIIFLGRLPSVFEPIWYLDENIYLIVGSEISKGKTLYVEIWDHKPPMILLIYAISAFLFGQVMYPLKILTLILALIALIFFYFILRDIFQVKNWVKNFGVILFAFLYAGPFEATTANAEHIFSPIIVIGVYLFWLSLQKASNLKQTLFLVIASILWAIAGFSKFHALIEVLVILGSFWTISFFNQKQAFNLNTLKEYIFSKITLKYLFSLVIVFLPYILSFIYYFIIGELHELWYAMFGYNQTYVQSQEDYKPLIFFHEINISGLIYRSLIFIVFSLFNLFFFLNKEIQWSRFFVNQWVAITFFATLLSERVYGHYLFQMIAPATIFLLLGLNLVIFSSQPKEKNKLSYQLNNLILVILVLQTFFLSFSYRRNPENIWSYYQVGGYYFNFYRDFSSGDLNDWRQKIIWWRFPRQPDLTKIVKELTNNDDSIFTYGSLEDLYITADRSPASRFFFIGHYNDRLSEVYKESLKNNTKLFVIDTNESKSSELINLIQKDFCLTKTYEKENNFEFWTRCEDR